MKQKLILCVVAIIVTGLCSAVSADEMAQITLQPGFAEGQLTMFVTAQLPVEVEAAGVEFALNYDTAMLEFLGLRPGPALEGRNILVNASVDHLQGLVHYSMVVLDSQQVLSGRCVIAELAFIPRQLGSSTLGFSQSECILGAWGGSPIACMWSGALVTTPDGYSAAEPSDFHVLKGSLTDYIKLSQGALQIQRTITVGSEQMQQLLSDDPVLLSLPEVASLHEYYGESAAAYSVIRIPNEALSLLSDKELNITADNSCLVINPQAVQAARKQGELAVKHCRVPLTHAQSVLTTDARVIHAAAWNWNITEKCEVYLPLPKYLAAEDALVYAFYQDGGTASLQPQEAKSEAKRFARITADKSGVFILSSSRPIHELVLQIGSRSMMVNGQFTQLDTAPFINSLTSRTMVPVRFVSEGLGAQVDWLPNTRQVRIIAGNMSIQLTIDSPIVTVNSQQMMIDAPPIIKGNRTFVPLRFVSEVLGAQVEYELENKRIRIIR